MRSDYLERLLADAARREAELRLRIGRAASTWLALLLEQSVLQEQCCVADCPQRIRRVAESCGRSLDSSNHVGDVGRGEKVFFGQRGEHFRNNDVLSGDGGVDL